MFVLFVISVNIRLILCSRFIAKNVLQVTSELYTEIHFQGLALLDQAEDWSTLWIGVSYGTILTLSNVASEERRERVERKKDNRIVNTKESLKGSRKESSEDRDAICPTTLLVLRQEDGAVRQRKESLRNATESRS